jgi:hypothetical protein
MYIFLKVEGAQPFKLFKNKFIFLTIIFDKSSCYQIFSQKFSFFSHVADCIAFCNKLKEQRQFSSFVLIFRGNAKTKIFGSTFNPTSVRSGRHVMSGDARLKSGAP